MFELLRRIHPTCVCVDSAVQLVLSPCCFLRHITVKRVAKADMMTRGTVMAMARMGPAHGEWTRGENEKKLTCVRGTFVGIIYYY